MNDDNTAMCRRRASLKEAAKRHKPNSLFVRVTSECHGAPETLDGQNMQISGTKLSVKKWMQCSLRMYWKKFLRLTYHQKPKRLKPSRMSSFRMTLALAAELNLKVRQEHMSVVRKALYGLRQAGREWNDELHNWMMENAYQRCLTEPCLYYRQDTDGTIVLVLVYVDDILCATNNEAVKVDLFGKLAWQYGIKDQGELTKYLGVEVQSSQDAIKISQIKEGDSGKSRWSRQSCRFIYESTR
ncbi:unnamed protein product [Peronospora effusa]|nr:unnamed protein product [Peronospora effusa]